MHKIIIPMALLMNLNLGSGLMLLQATQPQLKIMDTKMTIHSQSSIRRRYIIIPIAHTQPTINHMNVEQVHLKAFS